MVTRRLLIQSVLACGLVEMSSWAAPTRRPPNIILILADDLGYGDIGCFGSPNIRTPRIDTMAAEGLKLTCVYAEPFCGPARAAAMTGCYPIRVAEPDNIKNRHTILHDREITIAEVLRPAGYRSAMIGKWGLAGHSNNRWRRPLMPLRQGFDHYFGTPASNDTPQDVVLLKGDGELIEQAPRSETMTERYADQAIRFITSNRDRPFFVYFCPNMPHVALAASERFRGTSPRGLYGDVIEELDFHAGRIVDAVKRLDLERDTIVIFTSDNGPWIVKEEGGGSPGPFRGGKSSTWEGGMRVPGIVWAPGRVQPGRVSSEMVGLQDLLPTLAHVGEAPVPTDRVLDGLDLTDFLFGGAKSPRGDFAFYLWTHLQAVRKGNWKMHLPRPKDPEWVAPLTPSEHLRPKDAEAVTRPMLFDVERDYGERFNVASDYPQVVAELFEFVEQVRADLGDYNRLGANVRLFDSHDERPKAPARALH